MSTSISLGKLNLRAFRYCVLIVFLVCNALIASIAVWNLGLFRESGGSRASVRSIDSFSTSLGASGLVILITAAFAEVTRVSWFIATVWFECLWISLWGLMYVAAAITLTIITTQEDCTTSDRTPKCVSIQVLLAFTWLCALTLLIYFSTLIFAVLINRKKDATIWHSTMRKFPWAGTCAILASAPPTPALPRFVQNVSAPIIHAPKPKHARQTSTNRQSVFSWRSGLSNEYQIEHYQPQAMDAGPGPSFHYVQHAPSHSIELPRAAAPPVISASVLPPIAGAERSDNNFAASLYPMYMQQTVYKSTTPEPSRPEPALIIPRSADGDGATNVVVRTLGHTALPPSPPPLGNWPRHDILSQPVVKGKRKPPPSAIITTVDSSQSIGGDSGVANLQIASGSRSREGETHSWISPSSFQPMRPMGPRGRSGSGDWSNRLLVAPPAVPKTEDT